MQANSKQILIVDDNLISRQMLKHTLDDQYSILEASNGKEALEIMIEKQATLSAVLLDIVMPKMDGYQVLQLAKDNPDIAQIPIIMITGSEDEDARIKALTLGANDYILKPFNPDIVKHCLKNNIALRDTALLLNAIQRDKLTGLYNRETFFSKANEMIQSKESGFYIFSCLDIDNFKLINDQFGTEEGDKILKLLGATVKVHMEKVGGIACRIFGDNFAVLFPSTEKDHDILNKLQYNTLKTLLKQPLTFSIGRYQVNDLTLSASAIYDRAYIAKQSIKNRYDKHVATFDNAMLEKLVRDQQIVEEMGDALSEKQFEVWFQPQFNHASQTLIGAETLVRWRHPEKGLVPPNDFIPLFEQNGFIYELDKYIWREACRKLREWIDKYGYTLSVSVNVSRYDILRADFFDIITALVKEFNIPPHRLHLEVTESAFVNSLKQIVEVVQKLVDYGFTVEIDDFGSGYSSLNTLKNVPAQVIKLDMLFLEDDDATNRGGNILTSIVRMAKWLGMSVIAEGVETKAQADFLKSIGCINIQGYLYAKPMPAADFEQYFSTAKQQQHTFKLETVANLDNDLFWDPKSLDSLIFNSYVGAACVYEYHKGKIDLLRATDKYAHMLGGDKMTVEEVLKLDLNKHVVKTANNDALKKIKDAILAHGETVGEFELADLPNCENKIYLRATLRVIAKADNRYLIYSISENITAQKLSEQKESRAIKQLQAVMNNINCGITAFVVDENSTKRILANERYYSILGYTEEQYDKEIGQNAYKPIHPEDLYHVIAVTKSTAETGEPTSMEYRAVRRDGSVILLRSMLSLTQFEEFGEPIQICTYVDITAEKEAEHNLLDNLPCGAGICVIENDFAYIRYLNKRYFSYFKHRDSWSRSDSIFNVIHPDDRAALRIAIQQSLEKEGESSCIVRILDGEKDYVTFRVKGVAMETTPSEKSIYVIFVPIANENFSFDEMLPVALEAVMASSPDLTFVKDKTLHYICCSKMFAQMTGLRHEKLVVGKTDYDLFEKEFADAYVAADHSLMESKKSIVDMIEPIPSSDGKTHYSKTSKYLLFDAKDNIVGLYGVGRDVTESREAKLRQNFVLNNIPGGMAIYEGTRTDLNNIKLTFFSDGFCALFDYSREEYEKVTDKNPMKLVDDEYLPDLYEQVKNLVKNNTPIDTIYRTKVKNNGRKWVHVKANLRETQDDKIAIYVMCFDITKRQEILEKLKISEEENRLALQHSGKLVCRFDIATRTLKISPNSNSIFNLSSALTNIPCGPIKDGQISPKTAVAYVEFYNKIFAGKKSGISLFQRKSSVGWRWVEAHFSTIFSTDSKPVSAIISCTDITQNFEKDAVYRKWKQSFLNRDSSTYSLFRCNISKKTILDIEEGSLLNMPFSQESLSFEDRIKQYAANRVVEEDSEKFAEFLNADRLLRCYADSERSFSLEYREKQEKDGWRWLRITIDLVEYPYSSDIEAYLLFEDINEVKKQQLLTTQLAQTDPLTGLLNRMVFEEKVNQIIKTSAKTAMHALFMLDIDGFKCVNDAFGHIAGDNALKEIATSLRKVLGKGDLAARLGGDEFVIFLKNPLTKNAIIAKAKKICKLTHKTYGNNVDISGSIGIALSPTDGDNFQQLYMKSDKAMYHVKGSGRNNYAFYCDDMKDEHLDLNPNITSGGGGDWKPPLKTEKKPLMLIVDDNKISYEILANVFRNDFLVKHAKNGIPALALLKRYGQEISVVLLDLMMPKMDGFEVLEKMQSSEELRAVPVVVVSSNCTPETELKALGAGAVDFVDKFADMRVLQLRVNSAISKAENTRLRTDKRLEHTPYTP